MVSKWQLQQIREEIEKMEGYQGWEGEGVEGCLCLQPKMLRKPKVVLTKVRQITAKKLS